MTEPGAPPPTDGDGAADRGTAEPSALGEALGRLKRDDADADDANVSTDGRSRMSWSSVTEADPEADPESAPPETSAESSFQFDLGSALAKLGDAPDPAVPPAADAAAAPADPTPSPAPSDPAPAPTPARPEGHDTPPPPPTTAPPAPAPPAADELPKRETPVADLPRRSAPAPVPADELPKRRSPAPPPQDELPQRRASEPVDGLPRRRGGDAAAGAGPAGTASSSPRPSGPAADRSVFDTTNPAPSLPTNPQRVPSAEPTAPVLPAATAAGLPTLPSANPAAPPLVVESPSALSGPDLQAVRSFELRAQRDRRRSRFVMFMFLAVVVLGAVVAAALMFGRDWLFPTQWDEELIPLVDAIQLENEAEFTDPVELRELPAGDYAATTLEVAFGDDWSSAFPQWRALGLASGSTDAAPIVDAVIAWRPVVYDPGAGVIYRVAGDAASGDEAAVADVAVGEGTDGAAAEIASTDEALRFALQQAFNDQLGIEPADVTGEIGLLGTSSLREITARAVDRALLVGSIGLPATDPELAVPLPLLYEMVAIDTVGEPVLESTDPDPVPEFGDVYPDEVLDALVVQHPQAAPAPLPDGAEPIADPVALGPEVWSLVWQNRLPDPTTVRLRALVVADSYQPYVRSGIGCVAASFEAESDIAAGEVVTALTAWAAATPIDAAPTISISTTDPARVEFTTCDPGAAAEQSVAPATVTSFVERQLAELG